MRKELGEEDRERQNGRWGREMGGGGSGAEGGGRREAARYLRQ